MSAHTSLLSLALSLFVFQVSLFLDLDFIANFHLLWCELGAQLAHLGVLNMNSLKNNITLEECIVLLDPCDISKHFNIHVFSFGLVTLQNHGFPSGFDKFN